MVCLCLSKNDKAPSLHMPIFVELFWVQNSPKVTLKFNPQSNIFNKIMLYNLLSYYKMTVVLRERESHLTEIKSRSQFYKHSM